jgi:hypothetical protein
VDPCSSCDGRPETISAKQIERLLGLSYKSAWFVNYRIRAALREEMAGPIGGEGK